MPTTFGNNVHATPYANIMQFFSKVFGNPPEKEKQKPEQEKTSASFWESDVHVFPSCSDNFAKAFSQSEKVDEQQTTQDTVTTVLSVVTSGTNQKDKTDS